MTFTIWEARRPIDHHLHLDFAATLLLLNSHKPYIPHQSSHDLPIQAQVDRKPGSPPPLLLRSPKKIKKS